MKKIQSNDVYRGLISIAGVAALLSGCNVVNTTSTTSSQGQIFAAQPGSNRHNRGFSASQAPSQSFQFSLPQFRTGGS
jgi:hypothetical protein